LEEEIEHLRRRVEEKTFEKDFKQLGVLPSVAGQDLSRHSHQVTELSKSQADAKKLKLSDNLPLLGDPITTIMEEARLLADRVAVIEISLGKPLSGKYRYLY